MLKQSVSFSTLTSPSLVEKAPEEQELELPMLEARKRNPSIFSEDDLPSPSSISAERRKEPVRICSPCNLQSMSASGLTQSIFQCCLCSSIWSLQLCVDDVQFCLQVADNRTFFTKVLHFCISNWEKALILGILITLIVLVSVKVSLCLRSQPVRGFLRMHSNSPCVNCAHMLRVFLLLLANSFTLGHNQLAQTCFRKLDLHLCLLQGFSIFGTMLRWFEKQNNWKGWAVFLPVYTVNVALFLPGVIFILGAGFVFG